MRTGADAAEHRPLENAGRCRQRVAGQRSVRRREALQDSI